MLARLASCCRARAKQQQTNMHQQFSGSPAADRTSAFPGCKNSNLTMAALRAQPCGASRRGQHRRIHDVAIEAIGVAWRRRAGRDEVSYFVADRSLNTFWGFLGLASLTTGGSTTIALAALVYTHGVSGLWLDLSGALGLLALGLFFARRVRREERGDAAGDPRPRTTDRRRGASRRFSCSSPRSSGSRS